RGMVVRLLKELTTAEGCAVIMVTHDNRIIEFADRIVNIIDGRIVSDVVLSESLMICEFLKSVEVFKHLPPTELTNTAGKMKRRRYAKGDLIVRESDFGDEFFLISRGSVQVFRQISGTQKKLATLSVGDFFGEHALMTDEPRNSTCIAAEDTETFVLSRPDFKQALEGSKSFREQVYAIYFMRQ